jgi:HK97 family phage portal protein
MAVIEFRSSGTAVQKLSDLPGFTEILTRAGSGAVVNRQSAMRLAAVYACVKVICDDLAGLPVHVFKKAKAGGVEKVTGHPAQQLVKLSPNSEMRAHVWKKTRTAHVLLNGNSYSFIERSALRHVKGIWLLDPDDTVLERVKDGSAGTRGRLRYRVLDGYNTKYYDPEDILHIKGFSWNGLVGDSVITNYAREQIGIGIELDQFEAAFFKNGLNPGGIFTHPHSLGKNKDSFIKGVKKRFGGSRHRGLPLILEDGMEFKPYEVKMVDQQFLELLKVNKVDICGMFGVPQSRISISDSNTNYNNTEQEQRRYYQSGLLPWAIPDEQEMTLRLLTDTERKAGMYIKYNFDAFLRGDSKTRAEVNQIYHRMGVPLNTLLAQDDRNPVDGGDVGMVQISMAPIKEIGEIQKAKFGKAAGSGDQPDGKGSRSAHAGGIGPGEDAGHGDVVRWLTRASDPEKDLAGETEPALKDLAALEKQFHSRLKSAAAALVKKECDQVEAGIKEFFGARADTDFILWLDTFYKTFSDDVKKDFGPVLQEYAKVVHQEAGRIVETGPGLTDEFAEEMAGFVQEYLDTYAVRHTGSSLGQLKGLIAATDPEELHRVLTDRVQQWRDRRDQKIADDESIRVANAVARETWRHLGVTRLKWVTQGSAACPFCQQLAGRVVGIRKPFIDADEVLKGQDQEGNWMSIRGKKNHPPIHRGCVCAIVPD